MLINTQQLIADFRPQSPQDAEVSDFNQPSTVGYLKYGLYSRKTMFFHAFYKAYNLEGFKADLQNASILSSILSQLILYFLPNPSQWLIITTPRRIHSERLGYHFASEVLQLTSQATGIQFQPNVIGTHNKIKLDPDFYLISPPRQFHNIILFDDILTTGKTIYASLDVLHSIPQLSGKNIPVIVGINNN